MTQVVTSNYRIAPGARLSAVDEHGVALDDSSFRSPLLNIAGTLSVTAGAFSRVAGVWVGSGGFFSESKITVESGGVLEVHSTAPSGTAYGVWGPSWSPTVSNGGLIDVAATGYAYGVVINSMRNPNFENTGTIRVVSSGDATGVNLEYGAPFLNSGLIDVTSGGSRGAVAVSIGSVSDAYSFLNTGVVRAHSSDPTVATTGVGYGGLGPFINRGTIEGDYAISLYSGVHISGRSYEFTNTGTMIGQVDLGARWQTGGREVLHNSGLIRGSVEFGAEDDTYDGAGGVVTGSVHGRLGADHLAGGGAADSLLGDEGDDTLDGGGGADALNGNSGNDLILGGAGSNYLRGDQGDDSLVGGADFDDVHGNMGNDTGRGGDGFDWVVGGQGNDLLYGDAGGDIVYGNLGNDTQFGGDGLDWVRGGQGNDSLEGGAGDDWIWGDRGDDTVTGGAGADMFHFFSGAGLDRVTDFNYAQGDRVVIDYGTYTVSQVGADTVVDLGGGDRMVLVGVTASALPAGWISTL